MFIPLAKLGPVCGIAILFVMGFLFISQSLLLPYTNIWEDTFKLIHNDTELEFQSSGDFEWWTGLNWNMTIKAKLPCTHGEEMIEELSQADEEKSFKLLDQLHSAILLREREQIIATEHALGHFLRLENSDIFSSEEIDLTKFSEGVGDLLHLQGPGTLGQTGGGLETNIPRGKTLIRKLKISQGRLKRQQLDSAESFVIFRKAVKNYTTISPKENEGQGSDVAEFDDGERLYWLFDSDSPQFNSSEIDFLKSQLKTGVFLSLKVIGSESGEGIDYTLKTLIGWRENDTYTFSSNVRIDSESEVGSLTDEETFHSLDPTKDKSKPTIIRIPRGHAHAHADENNENEQEINYYWYNSIPYFGRLFSSPPPASQSKPQPRIVHFCLTYEHGIKGDVDILLPKAIVSFLICY